MRRPVGIEVGSRDPGQLAHPLLFLISLSISHWPGVKDMQPTRPCCLQQLAQRRLRKVGIPCDFEQMARPRQHHHATRGKCKKIVGQRLIPPPVVLLPLFQAHLLPLE